ncbi:MAG: HD domain-containing protein [Patescibacteria group bacterium]|nr:HD domain-containing protein [Patescibacteria group bacterium]
MIYSKLVHEAAEVAAKLHEGQFRKHPEGTPYFSHLAYVALILQKAGYDDEIVAAAFLHDAIEDTEYTAEKMRTHFGARVTELVLAVSEQKHVNPWAKRKRLYREQISESDIEAVALACADHLHNVKSLTLTVDSGIDIKTLFEIGIEERFAHERDLVTIFNEKLNGSELAKEFESAVGELELAMNKYV